METSPVQTIPSLSNVPIQETPELTPQPVQKSRTPLIIGSILSVIAIIAILVGAKMYFDHSLTPAATPIVTPLMSPTPLPQLEGTEDLIQSPRTSSASGSPLTSPRPTATAKAAIKPTATPAVTSAPVVPASPTPSPIVKTLNKAAGQEGNVTDTGYVSAQGYIDVGRTTGFIYRGFVGFDLTDIPSTATISKATLRLYQRSVYGSPYSALGTIQVDHLDYGTTLTGDSFSGGTLYQASFGTIGSSQLAEWKTLDVTAQVKKDRGLHNSSQFRLHFSTEAKGGSNPGDVVSFSASNNGSEQPQLVVEYY